jgi:hypothetical protein
LSRLHGSEVVDVHVVIIEIARGLPRELSCTPRE